MKDYIRRSAKFIVYIVLIFVVVLGILPRISQGKPMTESLHELLGNNRFILMFGLLIAYGFVFPLVSFVTIKRHLNGPFTVNRDKFDRAFAELNYIMIQETPEMIIFRKKSQFSRFIQWYEDEIRVYPQEDPVIISGSRRWIVRLDRIIDRYLAKENN